MKIPNFDKKFNKNLFKYYKDKIERNFSFNLIPAIWNLDSEIEGEFFFTQSKICSFDEENENEIMPYTLHRTFLAKH